MGPNMNTGQTCSTCTEQLAPDNRTGRCAECRLIERNAADDERLAIRDAWAELPDVTPDPVTGERLL